MQASSANAMAGSKSTVHDHFKRAAVHAQLTLKCKHRQRSTAALDECPGSNIATSGSNAPASSGSVPGRPMHPPSARRAEQRQWQRSVTAASRRLLSSAMRLQTAKANLIHPPWSATPAQHGVGVSKRQHIKHAYPMPACISSMHTHLQQRRRPKHAAGEAPRMTTDLQYRYAAVAPAHALQWVAAAAHV